MDAEVDVYIKKQKSPQQEICRDLRRIILKTFPDISEEMKVGVPCYGCSKDDSCGKFYIASLADHVNLGFSLRGLSKKEQALFEGTGKTMKHLKFHSIKDVDEEKVIPLLKLVFEK